MRNLDLPTYAYGGVLSYYKDMEVGTKFHVLNGHWDGEIVIEDGIKKFKVIDTGIVYNIDDESFAWTRGGSGKAFSLNNNKFAKEYHDKISEIEINSTEVVTDNILVLMIRDISELFNPNGRNIPERLANLALNIYSYCGKYNVNLEKLPEIEEYDMWHMIDELSIEIGAFRLNDESKGTYIKNCLAMVQKYAIMNNIDLEQEILSKSAVLDRIKLKIR